MGRLPGFRPPQFSEEDAWLPCWLQQCNGDWSDAESVKEDQVTFEQRIEELLCHQKDMENVESLRDEGGCSIGQLFISGTDSSPFSCAQSANNVVQFLCLSLDGDTESSALSDDASEFQPNYPVVAQPHEALESLGQKDANLCVFLDAGVLKCTETVDSGRHVNKTEFLKHDDNVNFSEAASDAVELCIAASEALVINEVIESDSVEKYFSVSAILEASLQLKQARLEVWENTFADSFSVSDSDNLSDLDDIIMESAYDDAGILFTELPGNELSVSQVKDTLEAEQDEELEHKKSGDHTRISDESGSYNFDSNIRLRNDLTADYCGSHAQQKVTCNPACDPDTSLGHCNGCSRSVNAQENCCLSVSAEEINTFRPENNPHESHVSSSPIATCRDEEKDNCQPNLVQERFHSRWLGGWTSNNEVKYTMRCKIPEPFVGQTSFLSESACTAPDVNSVVQTHNKEATLASQLSVPSENFSTGANNNGMLLSQDMGSSSVSLVDPLCSFVPCSISENLCSLPAINYGDPVLPITVEYKKDSVLAAPSSHNILAEGEKIASQTAHDNDSGNEVSRLSTSLRDYSMLLPSHKKLFGKDNHQRSSFFIERSSKLTLHETNSSDREEATKTGSKQHILNEEDSAHASLIVDHRTEPQFQASSCSKHNSAEENPIGTTVPESIMKYLPPENRQQKLLHCKNQSAKKLPAQKRVHFSERETDVPGSKRIRKSQTSSKPCYFARASKRLTRSSARLESRTQHMDIFRANLDNKKKRLIFQNMEFLLTGFSQQKEKEIEGLVRKYGGIVLSQIPSICSKGKRSSRSKSWALPVVLCVKKIQSFKFFYGCAVNSYIMRVNWLIDSIAAGSVLQPKRYMILPRNINRNDQVYTAVKYNTHSLVFNNLGVMLHGKTKSFMNITTILKHGDGQIFRTLRGLIQALETGRISMGVIVTDDESCATRHLRHCAMEQNIPVTSVYWIIKCLYAGQLIPLEESRKSWCSLAIKVQRQLEPMELSQEI